MLYVNRAVSGFTGMGVFEDKYEITILLEPKLPVNILKVLQIDTLNLFDLWSNQSKAVVCTFT